MSIIECGESECDQEASMRRSWPIRGCCSKEKEKNSYNIKSCIKAKLKVVPLHIMEAHKRSFLNLDTWWRWEVNPTHLPLYTRGKNSLWIKPTNALNSNFIDITTLHVSGSLSAHHQEFLAVHRLWYILCSCDRLLPGVGWNCSFILLLVANGSSKLHKMYQSRYAAKNSWWWAEILPETCRVVIPIKLEFSTSVGSIHKESVTMYGHTIVKSGERNSAQF